MFSFSLLCVGGCFRKFCIFQDFFLVSLKMPPLEKLRYNQRLADYGICLIIVLQVVGKLVNVKRLVVGVIYTFNQIVWNFQLIYFFLNYIFYIFAAYYFMITFLVLSVFVFYSFLSFVKLHHCCRGLYHFPRLSYLTIKDTRPRRHF